MNGLGIDPLLLLWQGLTFLVLLYLLRRFAYQPVLKMLDERANRIREGMAQAEQIRKELNEAQQSAQNIIGEARKEAEQLRSQTQQQGQRMIAAAQAEAREQREKMINDARSQIQAETEHAKLELRQEVGRLAIMAATRVVGQELSTNPKLHQQLIDEALQQAERPRVQ
ncbi:MAG TPA: F0F1 ATP synthase subunit B [Chloroflexia bacterium]|jgi:F-type H+-transporting ATPase subunit b|nr:F0F1 ATP synthase subunit B [Chloroflexia bacterium]